MEQRHKQKGLTLVELMVVAGIILIIATIILASIAQARENTREKDRISDLASIEFALTLYKEKERDYPSFPGGVRIGAGGVVDDAIMLYGGSMIVDPKAEQGVYEYWYDSSFNCTAAGQAVIYARTMEQAKNANYETLCTSENPDSTNGAGPNSFIVVLD